MYDSRDDDNHWDLPLVKFVSDAGEASFLFTLASASKSSFQGYGTRYRRDYARDGRKGRREAACPAVAPRPNLSTCEASYDAIL